MDEMMAEDFSSKLKAKAHILAIFLGCQPNANRQTDNISERNGVGYFTEKLEETP